MPTIQVLPSPISYRTATALASDAVNDKRERIRDDFLREFNGISFVDYILVRDGDATKEALAPDSDAAKKLAELKEKHGIERAYFSPLPIDRYIPKRFRKDGIIGSRTFSNARKQCKDFRSEVIFETSIPINRKRKNVITMTGRAKIFDIRVL